MADPLILVPGQIALPDDFNSVLQQHTTAGVKPVVSAEPVPLTDPKALELLTAAAARGEPIDLTKTPLYRYHLADGTMVEAITQDDGQYRVVDYKPSQRFQQQQAREAQSQTPAQQQLAREEAEIKANANLPKDQDPRSETNAQRAARADATIKQQGVDARQATIDADAAANTVADNKRADDEAAARRAAQNKPSVTLTQDGTQAVITDAQGNVTTKPTGLTKPPVNGQVVKGAGLNGEDMQSVVDPTTGRLSLEPLPGAQVPAANRPIPAGAPKYVPDYNAPDLGWTAYNEEVLQWTQSGGGTREQGRQLMEAAIGLGTQVASHGTTLTSQASTTRSQDITQRGQTLSEVQSRRSSADSGFDNAQSAYMGQAAHLGAGKGGLAADAFREALGARMHYAQQAGGYADVPAVPLSPAIASVRTTHYPDGTIVHERPHEPTVTAGPAAGAAIPAVTAGVTATNAAAINPTGANVQAANDATMAGSNAAFGAVGVGPEAGIPGVRTGSAMTGTGVDAPVGQGIPVNPLPGEPGNDPGAPVGQVPAYLQAARPVFDPSPVVAELQARGFSQAAIEQALAEHSQEMMGVVA